MRSNTVERNKCKGKEESKDVEFRKRRGWSDCQGP